MSLCYGCSWYLAWFKLPVVDDTSWDDGCVIPVACATVILACVVTLPGFTWHTPYKIKVAQGNQNYQTKQSKMCLNIFNTLIKYTVFRYVGKNKGVLKIMFHVTYVLFL